jgi:rhodanese-related sulfurtransferase
MNLFKLTLATTILALALSGCAAKIGTSPQGLELPIEKAALKLGSDVQAGGYKVVTTDELKKWLDEKKAVLVVSSLPVEDDKAFGTLPGAVNALMPKSEKELTPADTERLLKATGSDKEKIVVVYCGFVACRRSHIAAKLLVENGFKNVYRYPAGIAGWGEAGFPLVK